MSDLESSRFLDVLLAARRVREIEGGDLVMLPRNKNRDTVLALKEIYAGVVSREQLRASLLAEYRATRAVHGRTDDASLISDEDEREELEAAGIDENFLNSLGDENDPDGDDRSES